jgi:hypothetical protein
MTHPDGVSFWDKEDAIHQATHRTRTANVATIAEAAANERPSHIENLRLVGRASTS